MTSPQPSDLPSIASITPGGIDYSAVDALPLSAGVQQKPVPMQSGLQASAARITKEKLKRKGGTQRNANSADWQADAGDMYDLVGEQRFLANVLASRGAQARFYVGHLSHEDPLAAPEPTDDERAAALLDTIGKTTVGRSQIVLRALIHYFLAGETYLVGIPPHLIPSDDDIDASARGANPSRAISPFGPAADRAAAAAQPIDIGSLEWRTMSVTEVEITREGRVKLKLAELDGATIDADADDIYLIHSWRSHPLRAWEADSPTRSSLPVLRELVGLTMAISGQIDSRLAGAGILFISDKITNALKTALGMSLEGPEDPYTESLIEAMITPISDRSSAAANVPLVSTVPNGDQPVSDLVHHMTFDKTFDAEMREDREEAIRRLALGQDAPPELLLGTAGMNHWGAWLVREDVITTHIEPPLALLCDALTTQYLRPALKAAGYADEQINDLVVWYDVSHLVARPNRSGDALELYKLGELSGEALRRETGFDEEDAPKAIGAETDPAIDLALQLVAQAPSLMQQPGLPAIVEQIRAVQSGREATQDAAEAAQETGVPAGDTTAPDAEDTSGDRPADGPPAQTGTPPADSPAAAVTAAAALQARVHTAPRRVREAVHS